MYFYLFPGAGSGLNDGNGPEGNSAQAPQEKMVTTEKTVENTPEQEQKAQPLHIEDEIRLVQRQGAFMEETRLSGALDDEQLGLLAQRIDGIDIKNATAPKEFLSEKSTFYTEVENGDYDKEGTNVKDLVKNSLLESPELENLPVEYSKNLSVSEINKLRDLESPEASVGLKKLRTIPFDLLGAEAIRDDFADRGIGVSGEDVISEESGDLGNSGEANESKTNSLLTEEQKKTQEQVSRLQKTEKNILEAWGEMHKGDDLGLFIRFLLTDMENGQVGFRGGEVVYNNEEDTKEAKEENAKGLENEIDDNHEVAVDFLYFVYNKGPLNSPISEISSAKNNEGDFETLFDDINEKLEKGEEDGDWKKIQRGLGFYLSGNGNLNLKFDHGTVKELFKKIKFKNTAEKPAS